MTTPTLLRAALCFGLLLILTPLAAHGQYRQAPARLAPEEVLARVNELRAKGCRCGSQRMAPAPPLTWSPALAQAAQAHSDFMNERNRFSHRGARGSSVGDRVRDQGYTWNLVGENIAAGQISLDAVLESWMNSPGHCSNIMNPQFTEMGVATSGPYWTQVFARSRQ